MKEETYSEIRKDALKRKDKRKYLRHKLNMKIIVSVFLVIISLVILYLGFSKKNLYSIDKIEKGITDYKVYMNKDDVYNKDYQEPGFSYISSTIDYVKANYDYELKYNKNVETKYDYEIKSILTIREPKLNGKILYIKEYPEIEKKSDIPVTKDIYINEDVKIDYKKYNNYVQNYKLNYGVSVDANVKTVMIVNVKTEYNGKTIFNETRELNTIIPLGEHTLTIDTNNAIDYVEELTGDRYFEFNIKFIIVGGILALISIICVINIIITIFKYKKIKTRYDKKLEKILKEYDRIIVETNDAKIGQNFKNIISVNAFEELVDVRDNTEQPILYVERIAGIKSDFMVINNDTLYVYEFNLENLK